MTDFLRGMRFNYSGVMPSWFSTSCQTIAYLSLIQGLLTSVFQVKYYNNKDPPVEVSILKGQRTVMPQYGSFPMETTGSYGGWVTCAQNLVLLLDSLAFVPGVPEILPEFLVKQMLCQPK